MHLLQSKRNIIISSISLILLLVWVYKSYYSTNDAGIYYIVKNGLFEINVFVTGEVEAKNSEKIMGPSGIQQIGIYQIKITELIPEGTVVKKGDKIGELDRTDISTKIKNEENELLKAESEYIRAKLDTTLDLRKTRDELVNQEYAVKEKQITLEQSKFEPPATIRQATLDLERAKRTLEQSQQNYKIQENKSKAIMQVSAATLSQAETKIERMKNLLNEFTIKAPEDGMLIYQRDWNGRKNTVGSTINTWYMVVATLPDMSVMLSKTYVNEVDIRKVKIGQNVEISLDAFPEKKLTGKVVEVANVGEQSPISDAKVFEVSILINEKDSTLRPAMTTGNNIIANRLENVLFIPLESLHNQGDSLTYVYKKEGMQLVKKEVKIGQTNDNFAVVLKGLIENDKVAISVPDDDKNIKLTRLNE